MERPEQKNFPPAFLWGASVSSMQTEGGITNNDWAEAERLGKTPAIGNACDFYHRYESDLDIAKSLNFNTFRFSVEWSRVEPEEGKFNEQELEHYRKMAQETQARGMVPFVCIWHFSLPLWFVKTGAFRRKDASEIFARYAKKVTEALGPSVTHYITMNEPTVWIGEQGRILQASPGFTPNPLAGLASVKQLQRAHNRAYVAMKKVNPNAVIGVASHLFSFVCTNPLGALFARIAHHFWNRLFINGLQGHQDFIGVQYYQRMTFWQSKKEREETPRSDIGWQLHPEGIEDVVTDVACYGLPIYVTESGVADEKDQYRKEFIEKSLEALHRAIEKGVPVRGYLHWSLLDNYEFTHGYTMRFGLVAVDHKTQERRIRDSARVYGAIVGNNAV